MFDTHCHLTNSALSETLPDVFAAAESAGVHAMLSVATDVDDAAAALAVAQAHDQVWCTAGIHPSEAGRPHDLEGLKPIAEQRKCLAWGEIGLDNHWPDPPLPAQIELLHAQLEFIRTWDADGGQIMPVVIHNRKAINDLLPILQESGLAGDRFIFHCFTDGPDEATRLLNFGAALSFTGVVTYTNATDVAKASDLVPLDRLMIETDAPYLSPVPVRGVRPNQPAHVAHVAAFLAARRGLSVEVFVDQVDATAHAIYGLPA
ncbi:MAG: TatD family hydrolase [Phycisphaerales bacterium]|nr:TatD family hydrolase [Phycisphaerales bacterium]